MMAEPRAHSICVKFYAFTLRFFFIRLVSSPAREDVVMRVYMFGGVLAVMAGIGFFGLALPPHQGGASSPGVVLIHHTLADEGIDASDVRFGDCTTQRNLSDAGRLEAEAMGARFNAHGFVVQRVLVSPFCRTAETARLMKLRPIELSAAFQNIRGDGSDAISRARIDAARKILDSWS